MKIDESEVFHELKLVHEKGSNVLLRLTKCGYVIVCCRGLVPQLIGELILIWGIHSLTFAAERALVRAQLDNNEDRERGEKVR